MNSISKLIKAKTISFSEMMIRYYPKLKLNETEVMILILLYIQQDEENSILSTIDLKNKVSINEQELSTVLVGLVQKGFIELLISDDGKETFSMDKIIEKLGNVVEQNENKSETSNEQILKEIVAYVEKCFQKVVNSNDLIIINHWLDANYTIEEIKEAILACLKGKKMNLRYADAILANKHKEREIVTEVDEDIKQMLETVYVKRN